MARAIALCGRSIRVLSAPWLEFLLVHDSEVKPAEQMHDFVEQDPPAVGLVGGSRCPSPISRSGNGGFANLARLNQLNRSVRL